MTTITYRTTGSGDSRPASGTRVLAQFSAYAQRLSDRWQQWRMEREIEAMPFDMRKDFGWPAADIDAKAKRMQ